MKRPLIISLLVALPLLAGCGGGNNSASGEESICTTLNSTISAVEELQGGLMELNRATGGSETQIAPNNFELGRLGIGDKLTKAGISFQDQTSTSAAVQKFVEVAGQCLSEDTFQYLSNYLD